MLDFSISENYPLVKNGEIGGVCSFVSLVGTGMYDVTVGLTVSLVPLLESECNLIASCERSQTQKC